MDNYYQILGLENFCEDEKMIKNAYRNQVKYFHPDAKNVSKQIAEEKTKKLNVAYDVLSDANKKYQYDQQLRYSLNGFEHFNNENYYQQYYDLNDLFRNNQYKYSVNIRFGSVFYLLLRIIGALILIRLTGIFFWFF